VGISGWTLGTSLAGLGLVRTHDGIALNDGRPRSIAISLRDLSKWDVSQVTDMQGLFATAASYFDPASHVQTLASANFSNKSALVDGNSNNYVDLCGECWWGVKLAESTQSVQLTVRLDSNDDTAALANTSIYLANQDWSASNDTTGCSSKVGDIRDIGPNLNPTVKFNCSTASEYLYVKTGQVKVRISEIKIEKEIVVPANLDLSFGDLTKWELNEAAMNTVGPIEMIYLGNTMIAKAVWSGLDDWEAHFNISQWDVSRVTNMSGWFENAVLDCSYIQSWDVSSVTDVDRMFYGATLKNCTGTLSAWNIANANNRRPNIFGEQSIVAPFTERRDLFPCDSGKEFRAGICHSCGPGQYVTDEGYCADCALGFRTNDERTFCVKYVDNDRTNTSMQYILNGVVLSCTQPSILDGRECRRCVTGTEWVNIHTCQVVPVENAPDTVPVSKACTDGEYWSSISMQCIPCAMGTYEERGQCTPCSENTWSNNMNATSNATCTACPEHTTSPAGSSSPADCVPCATGSARDQGKPVCELCQEGQYSTFRGACQNCPVGQTSVPGSAQCIESCAVGQYHSSLGGDCVECESGKTSIAGRLQCDYRLTFQDTESCRDLEQLDNRYECCRGKYTPRTVHITFNNTEYTVCPGDVVHVTWNGNYHIAETTNDTNCIQVGMVESIQHPQGFTKSFLSADLTAEPGETRYFKGDNACANGFSTSCPEDTPHIMCSFLDKYRVDWGCV